MVNLKQNIAFMMLLVAVSNMNQAQGKIHHFVFDDMDDNNLFDFSLFDNMSQNMLQMNNFGANDKALASVRQALQEIKAEITQDDKTVTIKFNLANADKKAVDIEVKEYDKNNVVEGALPVDKDGKVQFYITSDALKIVRNIEMKQENKADKKAATSSYFKSSSSEILSLPAMVDISKDNVKAITKDKALYITLQKKKTPKTKVQISHS